jgi:glyoxylase-like metal-dependent hydrolase (beta-lactamase superfamily II)
MKIKTFEFNPLGVNTYLLSDETNECVVIDAACFYADEKALLLNYIIDHDYVVKHLINTHLHFDHIFGVNSIASHFGVSLECNKADEFLLDNISDQLKLFGIPGTNNDFRPEIGTWLDEGDEIRFGNQKLKVFHAPGHSPGSILFYSEDSGSVFSGDVLFRGSIGRTDLTGGNFEELVESIQTKLFVMPNETKVYPGHGPATTIGYEKKNNPFVGTL